MLVTLKEILKNANKNEIAVGAFNTPNLESILAVIGAAEDLGVPVIISHAELHESIMPLSVIGPIMLHFAKKASVQVCVHLDHGEDIEYITEALKLGFTSVMYDGSLLPYDENVRNSKAVVEIATVYGASVEAELGILGGREAGNDSNTQIEDLYTDPKLAERFVMETGIDALAASFGTAHGIYKNEPKLDFERLSEINRNVSVPVVMHGGSGVSPEDYRMAISNGIKKINYYSYMANAGVKATQDFINDNDVTYYHEIASTAEMAMKEDVKNALKIFGHINE